MHILIYLDTITQRLNYDPYGSQVLWTTTLIMFLGLFYVAFLHRSMVEFWLAEFAAAGAFLMVAPHAGYAIVPIGYATAHLAFWAAVPILLLFGYGSREKIHLKRTEVFSLMIGPGLATVFLLYCAALPPCPYELR